MSKWVLRGVMVASVLVSYNCKRRRTEDNSPPAPTTTPTPAQPGMPQPAMPQPAMPQPAMPQPAMPQPAMPQPAMPQPGMQGMQPMQPGMPAGGDFIASQMQMRQTQFATNLQPVMPLTRGTLAQGSHQDYAVTITPGRCYRIIGVGGVGVQDLDLKLYDPAGGLVDQDIATDNYPVIGLQQNRPLCPQQGGSYRLQVVMYAGGGEYGVQVFGGNP